VSATAVTALYRGQHVASGGGDESRPWNVAMLIVAILTMIAAYGAWLRPTVPNEPRPNPPNKSEPNFSRPTGVPPNLKASKAVSFALSQIGSPYIFGGTGPFKQGYDCSGLVMAAWAHAGVSIPRTSYGDASLPHVSRADLRPGDILLYAGDGHVAMYAGHGEIIDAPQPGLRVQLIPMSTYWYAHYFDGAVRPKDL
jgi:cell wall-associated NlpC family hydrolase